MNRLSEIETRLSEIKNEIETRGEAVTSEQLESLITESNNLAEEKRGLQAIVEKRNALLNQISAGAAGTVTRSFANTPSAPEVSVRDSAEYRMAWIKTLRQQELTDVERRAYTSAANSAGNTIPTALQNEILARMKQLAPMLGEVTLLHVNGNIRYLVEGVRADAAMHAENATIAPTDEPPTYVQLSGYEIAKLVQISDTVKNMSIAAFEQWLITNLSESLARKFESLFISGTGAGQPTGVDLANTWDATNSVTVGAGASLAASDVQSLIGLLPSGYDANAKFLMRKRTLYTDFLPLQDNSKNSIVRFDSAGGQAHIYGIPVVLSDYVDYHTAYLGDYKKIIANLAEDISIKSAYDINTNSYKYSAVAIFDCVPALGEAFVKLIKASA
jgi:HK97 family phage major capsid protein